MSFFEGVGADADGVCSADVDLCVCVTMMGSKQHLVKRVERKDV